ncbi:MAG: serine/threonine protein kinase, partial [Planctomycetota bacterium]|nr:serine/threonine protein kinase [Planctomycetota bacterium]
MGARPQLENYRIIEQIGKGAMGAVYKALQISLNRMVALKILPPKLATDKNYIARFLQEAKVAAKLNHENIVYVIDVGESHGVYYYAMEYVEGKTVKQIVEEKGVMEEPQVCDIALQAARALDCAYSHSIVHRDIKPSNLMVTAENVVKLCDFGLARQLDMDMKGVTATIAGTPYYISPEQIRNKPLDTRTDIYSLGGTLYFMVTGDVPFSGSSPVIVMTKHLYEKPTPPRAKNPKISAQLEAVILKCMQKRPEERFQSPAELIRALESLKSPKPSFPRIKPRRPLRRRFRR